MHVLLSCINDEADGNIGSYVFLWFSEVQVCKADACVGVLRLLQWHCRVTMKVEKQT